MSFKKIVEELQQAQENEGFLVLIRCGVFFVGIGKDTVILAENFEITNICFAEGICKAGIPVNRIDKMIGKIVGKNMSVVIYDYNPNGLEKDKNKKYDVLRRIVMNPVRETRKCLECEKCYYYDKRIYLRIMLKNRWIDEKKFKVSMELISEIGKIVGGLIKYYAKKDKK